MPDLEKVIKGLECCAKGTCPSILSDAYMNCPYTVGLYCDKSRLAHDAIALLRKYQRKKGSWDYGTQCSVCKGTIVPPWKRDTRVNFCPWCGADMRDSYDFSDKEG